MSDFTFEEREKMKKRGIEGQKENLIQVFCACYMLYMLSIKSIHSYEFIYWEKTKEKGKTLQANEQKGEKKE